MHRNTNRAQPASCQLCRSKKLKCNRAHPCTNCTARGVTCHFLVPPETLKKSSPITDITHLIGRVERLEQVVLNPQPNHTPPDQRPSTRFDALELSQNESLMVLTPISNNEQVTHDAQQQRDEDSFFLSRVGTREDSLLTCLSNEQVFRIGSGHELHHQSNTVITFPPFKIATLLFQSYQTHVDHMCRILHVPTVRALLKSFYIRLDQNGIVPLGQAALFLSIFASAATYYQPFGESEIATTEADVLSLVRSFSKAALNVLDHSRRTTSGTLEDVQANILMATVIYQLDGFSTRGRLLASTAALLARDLHLHKLDTDYGCPMSRDSSVRAMIDREVKRRVIWHIVSQDWLLGTVSGPQEGMYSIHSNHLDVRLPQDCTDDDLIMGVDEALPAQPTGMTCFLERVRFAHICREMVDTVPLDTSKLMQLPYERIIELDEKLQDFLSTLPFYFRHDAESLAKSKVLEAADPTIPALRDCISIGAHSRRCKLHQRFLLRQSLDARYAYSRHACLESARAIIKNCISFMGYDCPSRFTARMGMSTHMTHLALQVLVMDLCFNNKEEAEVDQVKAEVNGVLQMFERAGEESLLPSRFLNSLREFMQRYKVQIANEGPPLRSEALDSQDTTPSARVFDALDVPSFDEFWNTAFQGDLNIDSWAWDQQFSSLDSMPMV